MKKRLIDLRDQTPLLDIVSYGRGGGRPLAPSQRELIARTAGCVPEVMIKVSGGARTLAGVEQHLAYVGREGDLDVETDSETRLHAKGFERDLIMDWDLDLEAHRRQTERSIRPGRKPPKLVHNIIFSMPAGTPADKVLRAVRKFTTEEFALKHRYAMVLHTDDDHPHVHVVVKAVSERGERLNIRKATLREWRRQFASNLRELGVAANATERAVRGATTIHKRDGIFRAYERGASTYMRERERQIAVTLSRGLLNPEPGTASLVETRNKIVDGWRAAADRLKAEGHHELAARVERFVDQMPPVQTENELIAAQIRARSHARQIDPPVRTR